MAKSELNGLELFHPLIRKWFGEKLGAPTDIQSRAWPVIADQEHVLITAPTGSGKTLTAFLWSLNQLITDAWPEGQTSVLYVSPLKALNNDIHRNLKTPLHQLRKIFDEAGQDFPELRVMTRSGDTPQSERRQMLRRPPEILITTPESLNLILTSGQSRKILTNLRTIILDEIHSILDSKRGTHLITAVDRIVPLSGEFQRIALSATVKPLETVAKFIGGYMPDPVKNRKTISGLRSPDSPFQDSQASLAWTPDYIPRTVLTLQSRSKKKYDLSVDLPAYNDDPEYREDFWRPLVEECREIISGNRSTLFFVNSRKLAETITLKINADSEFPLAYAHHGSLSREIRHEVEQKLKAGDLKAIVATGSLEMGIDIGDLDQVVLIQSPHAVATTVQRIGRAGHHVGEVSRAVFYPTEDHDFLESAVLARAVIEGDIESISPIESPLDVLAQIIVSMVNSETWHVDKMYSQIRCSYPFRNLDYRTFTLVLGMLAGRYEQTRIRELKPRISWDRVDNTVSLRKGAQMALYMSGGTIPDRGYFHLRHMDTGARIGELDEEFVWEAKLKQTFTFGTQHWRIEKITHNDVLVRPGNPKIRSAPFWKGEEILRNSHLSEKISDFLERANTELETQNSKSGTQNTRLETLLVDQYAMTSRSADLLVGYLKSQKDKTGVNLPHRHHLLIEHVNSGPDGVPGHQIILHNYWGGKVNRPFALAMEAAWEKKFGQRLEIYAGNDCIILHLADDIPGELLIDLVHPENIESLLRTSLEGSGFFGARFREAAGRALLLQKSSITKRMPLWMSRMHSQKLLNTVMKFEDFPILIETWRTCIQDYFDIPALCDRLDEVKTGTIQVSECRTPAPSPMARHLTFRQINDYMYRSDVLTEGAASRLDADWLRDVVFQSGLRPEVSAEIIGDFEIKRQRLSPGYSPSTAQELLDWVKERVVIPADEWQSLGQAIRRDHPEEADDILSGSSSKIVRIQVSRTGSDLICAREMTEILTYAFYASNPEFRILDFESDHEYDNLKHKQRTSKSDLRDTASDLLSQFLSFYGPGSVGRISKMLSLNMDILNSWVNELTDEQSLIQGLLILNSDEEVICDSRNFEILLRMSRKSFRPEVTTRPIEDLPAFLAQMQGINTIQADSDHLHQILDQLLLYAAPASFWEKELLPARLNPYDPHWLDRILQEDLQWMGSKKQQIFFSYPSDLDLLNVKNTDTDITGLFIDSDAKYDYLVLLRNSGLLSGEFTRKLWNAVWQGLLSNDSFQAVRKGIENKFRLPEINPSQLQSRRSLQRSHHIRWKNAIPFTGSWFVNRPPDNNEDILEREERGKDRVRILLDRYGILFKELLLREIPEMQWANIFRSLRLMELAGEVFSGYFFEGIPGAQFISAQALSRFRSRWEDNRLYWLNAADPASVCGLPLESIRALHPARLITTHLVYRGRKLIFISQRLGRLLDIRISPDDPDIEVTFAPLRHLLNRAFQPLNRIAIESINGRSASGSPYAEILRRQFETVTDYKTITLYRNLI